MRQALKTVLEHVVGSRATLAAAHAIRPTSGVVLAYHNVVPAGGPSAGDRSLHLPLNQFVEQIDWLTEFFTFTELPSLLDGTPAERPKVVLTFDDAYRGAVHLAIPELQRRGVPATIFVCSRWKGGELPWWDALADPREGLNEHIRDQALNRCRGRGPDVLRWAREAGISPADLPAEFRIASPEAIRTLVAGGGVSVGIHGTAHANLCALSDEELETELVSSRRDVLAAYPCAIDWLAYPYGLADDRVAACARRAGLEGALKVSGGPIREPGRVDRFRIPRLNVPAGVSLRGFRLRTTGIL